MDGEIAFATVGSSRVAYAVHGTGDLDIVYAPGIPSHLDVTMEQPRYRHYIDGLMQFGRVIRFDRRGTGISDPIPADAVAGWELWADDLEGVLRAVDSKRAVVIAANDAGPSAMLFAATHRDLVSALVLFNTTARFLADESDDAYPGHPADTAEFVASVLESVWGTEDSIPILAPSLAADAAFCRWYARFQRAACSPGAIADSMRRVFQFDARSVLPEICCPTLVMHRENWPTIPLEQGQALAARIPGAELAVMPGGDAPIWAESMQESIDRIGAFLGRAPARPADAGVFRTVLFTDIVSSTEMAVQLGDERWRRLIDDYDTLAYETVRNYDGRRIKAMGDGTLATFDRPSRALRAALDIVERVRPLGIDVRAGAHTGPVAVREDGDISGLTVNATARVLRVAQANEVLSTGMLADLVQDDDFAFTSRGEHQFKGFDEAWPLFAVALAAT